LSWGLAYAGRSRAPQDGVFTHGYPERSATAPGMAVKDWVKQLYIDPGRRIFWFSGTFVGSIDLSTVIEAARLLRDRSDVMFVFSGSGQQEAAWREQAKGLSNIRFTGWLDREQLDAMAARAWVGLGAYKKGALMSLTNKIFEYMAYGLPILISLPGDARR